MVPTWLRLRTGSRPLCRDHRAQRDRWDLSDLVFRFGAPVVDEARALVLLQDGASQPHTAATPFPGLSRNPWRVSQSDRSGDSALDDAVALSTPGARFDAIIEVLEAAGVPPPLREPVATDKCLALAFGDPGFERERGRLRTLLALPWQRSEPQGFDRARVAEALDRTHGALEGVKNRVLRVLAASPQTRDLLTVERPCFCRQTADAPPALVVRPGVPRRSPSILCLAGPRGSARRRSPWRSPRRSGAPTRPCRWVAQVPTV